MDRIKELSKTEPPLIGGLNDFVYSASNLTLRDIDNLIAMMQEFVGRLDEKSLSRANPFEGDRRVQLWQDMANVFKMNEANELGIKIDVPSFFHPQLRFIYTGESI